jgi:eukaryotic-like serine/threonine-protein kinase
MAPEQFAGDVTAIGPQSDVFALGATIYTLLTGRPPFQGATAIETLELVRSREPAPPRTLVPGLPRDLETITLTCLRKDPRRRYATAGAIADDLNRWLAGFPIRARPVSKLEHAGRWCRRRPALASLLAVLALTMASSLVGLLTLWRHSEAERARAEKALARAVESDKATSGAVRELVGLLTTAIDSPPLLASEPLEKSARVVRDLTAKLRQYQGFAASNLVAICDLERQLAEDLRRRGKFPEARAFLVDSLDLLDRRRRAGGDPDPDVENAYAQAQMEFGRVALNDGRLDESLARFQHAEAVLEGLVNDPRRLGMILSIDVSRRAIARLLDLGGAKDQRRKLLESHCRMLDQLSDRAGGDPAIGVLAAEIRANLATDGSATGMIRAAIQRFPPGKRLSPLIAQRVAAWIALDIEPYACAPKYPGGPNDSLDPKAHADAVIRTIESRCESLGVGSALFPATALEVANVACYISSARRKAVCHDDARRISACLSAFAEALLRRDPNEAAFHSVLSKAFVQEEKNAWTVKDYPVIEDRLRKALGAAYAAFRLDPRNMTTRMDIAGLQDKLVGLAADPPLSR